MTEWTALFEDALDFGYVIRLVGEGGVHIAPEGNGYRATLLAVQFVLNGITGYYNLMAGR